VDFDRVEAVGLAAIDPGVDLAEDEGALSLVAVDVEPALLTEARDRLPEETAAARGVEVDVVLVVGPEGLVGPRVDVADRLGARRVDGVHAVRVVDVVAAARGTERVGEEVDVVDLRAHGSAAGERHGGDAGLDPPARDAG